MLRAAIFMGACEKQKMRVNHVIHSFIQHVDKLWIV